MVSGYNFAHGSTETESLNFEKISWTYTGLPALEDCLALRRVTLSTRPGSRRPL